MKNLTELDAWRETEHSVILWGWSGDHTCGAFFVPSLIDGKFLKIIASVGEGWDHVSVSREFRCPYWMEMDQVKKMFFHPHECAMQLHPPEYDYVNCHPFCLHLWRPLFQEIVRPPSILVGPGAGELPKSQTLTTTDVALPE